jgi:hypothetical protein
MNFSENIHENIRVDTILVERFILNIPANKNVRAYARYNHFYLNKIEKLSYFFRTVFGVFRSVPIIININKASLGAIKFF